MCILSLLGGEGNDGHLVGELQRLANEGHVEGKA